MCYISSIIAALANLRCLLCPLRRRYSVDPWPCCSAILRTSTSAEAFQRISEHLATLEFEAQPDYSLLREALTQAQAAAAATLAAQQPASLPATPPPDPSQATGAASPLPQIRHPEQLPGAIHSLAWLY